MPASTIPVGGEVELTPSSTNINDPTQAYFGTISEANEQSWRRLLSKPPRYATVAPDAIGAPFGNNPTSTIYGWEDYACTDEVSAIAYADSTAGSDPLELLAGRNSRV